MPLPYCGENDQGELPEAEKKIEQFLKTIVWDKTGFSINAAFYHQLREIQWQVTTFLD
jgi:hypothetical protein